MAKRSPIQSNSQLIVGETAPIVELNGPVYNSGRVVLRSKFPAHLRIRGPVTGELYETKQAGDSVEVDVLDVELLLQMTVGTSVCCGATAKNYLYERV